MTTEDDRQQSRDAQSANAAAQAIFQMFQDWLKRVESKIDTLTGRLEGKADRAEVADLAARLDQKVDKSDLERFRANYDREAERIHQKLDTESDRLDAVDKRVGLGDQRDNDRTEWQRWVIPVGLTLVYTAATIVLVFYTVNHH